MRSARLAVVLGLGFASGCGETVPPPAFPAPAPLPPPSEPEQEEPAAGPAPVPIEIDLPRVVVERMDGAERQEAERILQAVREELRECAGGAGGLVRIELTGSSKTTKMTIDPESMGTVDSHTRTCVLKALSTVDLGESLLPTSPSDKPSGFAAQLTVSW